MMIRRPPRTAPITIPTIAPVERPELLLGAFVVVINPSLYNSVLMIEIILYTVLVVGIYFVVEDVLAVDEEEQLDDEHCAATQSKLILECSVIIFIL